MDDMDERALRLTSWLPQLLAQPRRPVLNGRTSPPRAGRMCSMPLDGTCGTALEQLDRPALLFSSRHQAIILVGAGDMARSPEG